MVLGLTTKRDVPIQLSVALFTYQNTPMNHQHATLPPRSPLARLDRNRQREQQHNRDREHMSEFFSPGGGRTTRALSRKLRELFEDNGEEHRSPTKIPSQTSASCTTSAVGWSASGLIAKKPIGTTSVVDAGPKSEKPSGNDSILRADRKPKKEPSGNDTLVDAGPKAKKPIGTESVVHADRKPKKEPGGTDTLVDAGHDPKKRSVTESVVHAIQKPKIKAGPKKNSAVVPSNAACKKRKKAKPKKGATTGRWETWERFEFLRGLRRHGRGNWKTIGESIPTR